MNEWMDGRVGGWMDGWLDRQIDGWMGGWMIGRMDGMQCTKTLWCKPPLL